MRDKIKRIGKHSLYAILSNALYGLIVFFTFSWLSAYSLLLAYLGNLVLIILGVVLDEGTYRLLGSEKLLSDTRDGKDAETNYRVLNAMVGNFVSFKTVLYLFYVFILIVSQVIEVYPALVSKEIANFIFANNYSILFLIAFDMLIKQFSKDRERMGKIAEKLEASLPKNKPE